MKATTGMAKKLVLVLGLLSLTVGIIMSQPAADVNAVSQNLQEIHENTKNFSNKVCMSCHAKLINVGAGTSGNLPGAHKRHTMSVFLNFASNYTVGSPANDTSYGCGKCHQLSVYGQREAMVERNGDGGLTNIILGSGFGADLEGDISYNRPDPYNVARRQVNAQFCRQCHGQYPKSKHVIDGVEQDYGNESPRICVTCHKDGGEGLPPDIAHGAGPPYAETTAPFSSTQTPPLPSSPNGPAQGGIWWIDQRYATAVYCTKCHGELDWYLAEETNPSADPSASCLTCHSAYGNSNNLGALPAGTSPPDIESRMMLSSAHPVNETNLNTNERVMQCIDCHELPSAAAYKDGINHHRDGILQSGLGADALVFAGGGGSMRISTETSDFYNWFDDGVTSSSVQAFGPCYNCHSESRLVGMDSLATYPVTGGTSDGDSHYWSDPKVNPADPYPIKLPGVTRHGTNFRKEFLGTRFNLHWEHLDMDYDDNGLAGPVAKQQKGFVWDWSDDGPYLFSNILTGYDNARPSCSTCHDSHGSNAVAMTKSVLEIASTSIAGNLPNTNFRQSLCYACHGANFYIRDKLPVGPKNVGATPSSGQVVLSWENRITTWRSGTRKTKIMRKTGSYPAHENDGTLVVDVDSVTPTGTYTDTGTTSGQTYYYRLFTHYTDEPDLFGTSPRARAIASP